MLLSPLKKLIKYFIKEETNLFTYKDNSDVIIEKLLSSKASVSNLNKITGISDELLNSILIFIRFRILINFCIIRLLFCIIIFTVIFIFYNLSLRRFELLLIPHQEIILTVKL